MDFEDYDEEALEEIISEGVASVECTNCERTVRIEPDGDYPCPHCGEGRVTSPLILLGWI